MVARLFSISELQEVSGSNPDSSRYFGAFSRFIFRLPGSINPPGRRCSSISAISVLPRDFRSLPKQSITLALLSHELALSRATSNYQGPAFGWRSHLATDLERYRYFLRMMLTFIHSKELRIFRVDAKGPILQELEKLLEELIFFSIRRI